MGVYKIIVRCNDLLNKPCFSFPFLNRIFLKIKKQQLLL